MIPDGTHFSFFVFVSNLSWHYAVNTSAPSPKAAAISDAINGVNAGAAQNQVDFLNNLSLNPAEWFDFAAAYVTIDPPGVLAEIGLQFQDCGAVL